MDKTKKKAKAHQKYYLNDGSQVPGATTLTGQLNKPALVPWANNLGLQGVKVGNYVDDLARIGTLAHYLIECHLQSVDPDLDDYTPNQIDLAENAVLSFYEWEKNNNLDVIFVEKGFVSEQYRFGGTIDIYATLNGKRTLIDLKTSKGVFPEHMYQVAAYRQLLIENGNPVDDVVILRVGREESEGFDAINVPNVETRFEVVKNLVNIYYLQKQLRKK